MPLVCIHANVDLPQAKQTALLLAASKAVSEITGKPEAYVMTLWSQAAAMTMAGTPCPCCWIELRGIGRFTPEQTRAISNSLCSLVERETAIAAERVYLNFEEFTGAMWGHNSSTFG